MDGANYDPKKVRELSKKRQFRVLVTAKAFLGVRASPASVRGEDYPCVISEVVPGEGAEAAGVQPGDVVTKLNNQPVSTFQDLVIEIGARNPGDMVSIEVKRRGKKKLFTAKLGKPSGL